MRIQPRTHIDADLFLTANRKPKSSPSMNDSQPQKDDLRKQISRTREILLGEEAVSFAAILEDYVSARRH